MRQAADHCGARSSAAGRAPTGTRALELGGGRGKTAGVLSDIEAEKILKPIQEILARGNTAEVKCVKGGVIVLEVQRRIRERV